MEGDQIHRKGERKKEKDKERWVLSWRLIRNLTSCVGEDARGWLEERNGEKEEASNRNQ